MTDNSRRFRNIKNNEFYTYVSGGIDCTNSRNGTSVVIYYKEEKPDNLFIREENEFFRKFKKVSLEEYKESMIIKSILELCRTGK